MSRPHLCEYDPRYIVCHCDRCGKAYQRIDWNCASHQLTCGYTPPPLDLPIDKTIIGWQRFDEAAGRWPM